MAEPPFNTAAVVLGMHRSGTSALAGVLGLHGFAAPKTMLSASPVNERGFWESERVNALNDELLAELGTTWHGLETIDFDQIPASRLHASQERAQMVLAEEFLPGSKPLIKDPRLCRLLPFWRPAFAHLCAETVFAITFRNPVEVARSLSKRNDFDPDLGYLLWARYYLDAEFHTRGLPRAIVDYTSVVTDWREAVSKIERVASQLDGDRSQAAAVDEYLSTELRHYRTANEQVFLELDHLPLLQQTFRTLLDWSVDVPGSEPNREALDSARTQFDSLSGMLANVVESARRDRKRVGTAKSRADDLKAELGRARRAGEDLDRLRTTLDGQTAAQERLESRLESVAESLTQAIRDRSALEQLLAESRREAQEQRAALELRIEAATREAEQHQALLIESRREAQEQRAALELRIETDTAEAEQQRALLERAIEKSEHAEQTLRDELQQLRSEAKIAAEAHAWERKQSEQKLGVLSSQRAEMETELKDVKRKYRSTQHQLSRDREKLRRTQERLAQLDASLTRIRNSAVWRGYTAILATVSRCEALLRRTFGGSERKHLTHGAALIRTSSLFDADWYRARYSDVAAAGTDPAFHYLENGWREGRDPGPSFSTNSYLKLNADVSRAGTNPLLHYIEFGFSEGRNVANLVASPSAASIEAIEQFGPAAPCASFGMPVEEPIRWQRAARAPESNADLLHVGGAAIGLVPNSSQRQLLVDALTRFARLSGYSEAVSEPDREPSDLSWGKLLDAWYVGKNRLRTRWRCGTPTVIRGYQHECTNAGALSMVGEGLAVSQLDFVDFNLSNPYFPLLFVFAAPDGVVRGSKTLAFPSLCRGGVHYPEMLAFERQPGESRTDLNDVVEFSGRVAERMLAIADGSASPVFARLQVDLEGADGSEPIFQLEFRVWLSTVARIEAEPLRRDGRGPASGLFTPTAPVQRGARNAGGTLIIPGDSVPAISALVAANAEAGAVCEQIRLPLLVCGADPAQPVTMFEVSGGSSAALRDAAPDLAPTWPRTEMVVGTAAADMPAAGIIRQLRRSLPTDSELLVPVADPALSVRKTDFSVTWLVFPEDWQQETLRQGLHALLLQDAPELALIGDVPDNLASIARALFRDRVRIFSDVTTAIEGIHTRLAGYIGGQTILHDRRTSQVLAGLLDDSSVVSASCVIVSTEKRGKAWHVSVVDPGEFSDLRGERLALADRCRDAQYLWRTTYPVLRPPRDLWVAKTSSLSGWLQRAGPLRPHEGVQLCTSLVTASFVGERQPVEAHLRPPAASDQRTLRAQVLFG